MKAGEIGQRIRELRGKRGLTQLKLAAAAGVDSSMLSKVEGGDVDPSLNWIEKVAPALGVQLVLELVDATDAATVVRDDSEWGVAVDAYLRTTRGSSTPPWVAAKLMAARHSHLEAEGDLMLAVHDTRREIEAAESAPDLTNNHPVIDVPPKKPKK